MNRTSTRVGPLTRRDVDLVKREIWRECHVGPDAVIVWNLRSVPTVAIAPDNLGHVWITLLVTSAVRMYYVRIDSVDEIAAVLEAYPDEIDRSLLQSWYELGLEDALRRVFGS